MNIFMEKKRKRMGGRKDVSMRPDKLAAGGISTNDVLKIAKRSFKRFDALYRKLAE